MNKLPLKALVTVMCVFSGSVLAESSVIECNDCTAMQKVNAVAGYDNGVVFVADFVNYKLNKFVISDDKKINQAQLTVSEVQQVNQQFDYRKTTLIAAK
ncbi:hypothetical protein [Shewanella sp. ENK2]|uniref:hypothetical protein n=1 Tax=Shewanella sp. ENK2 TaxID=2775245 RepID=UPI00374954B5